MKDKTRKTILQIIIMTLLGLSLYYFAFRFRISTGFIRNTFWYYFLVAVVGIGLYMLIFIFSKSLKLFAAGLLLCLLLLNFWAFMANYHDFKAHSDTAYAYSDKTLLSSSELSNGRSYYYVGYRIGAKIDDNYFQGLIITNSSYIGNRFATVIDTKNHVSYDFGQLSSTDRSQIFYADGYIYSATNIYDNDTDSFTSRLQIYSVADLNNPLVTKNFDQDILIYADNDVRLLYKDSDHVMFSFDKDINLTEVKDMQNVYQDNLFEYSSMAYSESLIAKLEDNILIYHGNTIDAFDNNFDLKKEITSVNSFIIQDNMLITAGSKIDFYSGDDLDLANTLSLNSSYGPGWDIQELFYYDADDGMIYAYDQVWNILPDNTLENSLEDKWFHLIEVYTGNYDFRTNGLYSDDLEIYVVDLNSYKYDNIRGVLKINNDDPYNDVGINLVYGLVAMVALEAVMVAGTYLVKKDIM